MNRNPSTNKILLAAAVGLLALSAFTYRDSVTRAQRFERGQKLLPNLNPDEVAQITLRQGADEVVLERSQNGDRFVVQSANGYRADNAKVNRFLRDVIELGLDKEIGASTDTLAEKLGLGADAEDAVEIVLKNAQDKDMVHFKLGQTIEGGSGRYVLRYTDGTAGTIYLTAKGLSPQTQAKDYLDQQIVDVPRADVVSIEGDGFRFTKAESGDSLVLEDLPAGKKESSKTSQVKGALSPLRFDQVHLANAPEVQGLAFDRGLRITLKDGSGYVTELAKQGETYYLRIGGFHTTEQVYIEQDASEEEVKETSQILVRADEMKQFNEDHGSWIYEISSYTAERFDVTAADLVQDAG